MTSETRSSATSSSSSSCWVRVAMRTVVPRLTLPSVGCTAPVTRPRSVDLPAPLTPRIPVRSPGAIRQVTSRSTGRVPPSGRG
ncbi:Uncharacterised protein [Mycobacteroides abscessus subsp. abscessus]|nr:Uncharacterised protein [Mycobacteroides abscessus subsp. abscessus]